MIAEINASFLAELLYGLDLRVALYTDKADVARMTAYSSTGEVQGAGYKAGGQSLTLRYTPGADVLGFDPVMWKKSVITARRALVYEVNGARFASFDFGRNESSIGDDFILELPELHLLR